MKNIFCPNGTDSLGIIKIYAKKEFGNQIKECNSLVEMKREIIRALRRLSATELEENRIKMLVEEKHLEENDFSNFISVRFAYWGMMIAIAALLVQNKPINQYFNLTKTEFGFCIAVLLVALLVSMSRTIHIQHDRKEYLNFKQICFEELLNNRNNSSETDKSTHVNKRSFDKRK